MQKYMVYDIGGTSIKWSIITENGDILISSSIKTPNNVEEFFNVLASNANINKEKYGLKGIAISSPGAVDVEKGIINGASAIPYIHGPNFKEVLYKKTKLCTEIENDANCAALGESWIGSAKDVSDAIFIVCGSGIGGAIIKDKRIHSGANKHGGEFGYCIVDFDSESKSKYAYWSEMGSTVVLARNIAKRKEISESDMDGLKAFKLFDEGDEIAREEVDKYYTYMAIGIYNMQYIYDPEVVVLGGAISEREGYIEAINEKLNDIMSNNRLGKVRPKLRKCMYGNNANKLGALYNFLQRQDKI